MTSELFTKYLPVPHERNGALAVEMLIPAYRCAACERVMVEERHLAPIEARQLQTGQRFMFGPILPQLANADIRVRGTLEDAAGVYCIQCEREARTRFTCALCGEQRPSNEVERTFGYGLDADALCKPCYATKPAREWDAKVNELYASHRYDNE